MEEWRIEGKLEGLEVEEWNKGGETLHCLVLHIKEEKKPFLHLYDTVSLTLDRRCPLNVFPIANQ